MKLWISVLVLFLGLFFVFLGTLCWTLLSIGVHDGVQTKGIVDKPDHPEYDKWANRKTESYITFYNLTNKDAVMNGSRPVFQTVGPFHFKKLEHKDAVEFLDDGNRVKFVTWTEYEWQADTSVSDPKTTMLTVANLGYWGALQSAGSEFILALCKFRVSIAPIYL